MSERELEGIMRYVHDKYGAEEEGYPPIVGAGANGCILHYEENNATAVKNQLVLMDVGAMYHGYSADVTRTFPANGKFTEEQKAIYNAVYDAQEEVFKLCKEGVNYGDLETKTREILSSRLIALGLIKELGHPILSSSLPGEMVEEYTDPDIIHDKFEHLVDIVVDGGIGGIVPSTVVDCTGDEPEVIRKGLGVWETEVD